MRISKTITLLLLLLTGFLLHGNAQNVTLVVTTTNGVEQTYPMTEESQLYFDNGESLMIVENANSTVTYPLSEIRKIVFTEITGIGENTESELQILPNPSHNHFIVKNLPENSPARIYALDGRLVKEFEASEGKVGDISELSEGMYLLHIHGQTLKLMKQ